MERPLPPIPGTEECDDVDDDEDDVNDEYYATLPDQQTISLKLDPLEGDHVNSFAYLTPLRELVTSYTLPITVRVGCSTEDGTIEEGDLLVLHFIVWRKRVPAKYDDGTEVVLPVHASQLYDVLPKEQVHDDMVFYSTRDVINSKPLPERVKVMSPDDSESEYSNFGKNGDTIDISYVGEVDIFGFDKRLVLVGTCNGSKISIDESVKCAYTTMIESEPQTLHQILKKHSLPLRVRRSNDRVGLLLSAFREEAHVLATHVTSKKVISIPVDGMISLRHADDGVSLSEAAIPLYSLVNWTLCKWEHGRTNLPTHLQEIPEPLPAVSRQWCYSDDGKYMMRELLDGDGHRWGKKGQATADILEDAKYGGNEQGISKKKSSIRDKFKQIRTKRRSSETNELYGYLEKTTESQGQTNTQIQEMKSVLTAKEMETVKLQKENETLRKESQKLQEQFSQLSVSNRQYVDKLHKMIIEQDSLKESKRIKSQLAPSNEYVGMTSTNNAFNATTSSSINQLPVPKEETRPSTSVDHKIRLPSASVEDIAQFLRDLKLDSYVDTFREELVNGSLLLELDFDTLFGDLNMSRLHAKRLIVAIKDHDST